MTNVQSIRSTILSESQLVASKRRFGLFSQPLPIALGDNGQYHTKIHPRDESGKPITLPRMIYVSPNKQGQGKSSYFGPLNSLATSEKKDIFMQQGIRLLKQQHSQFLKGRKQTSFFPTRGMKPITNLSYSYLEQRNPEKDPKRYKMNDGRVRAGPKNFYTNQQSTVIDLSFKKYPYVQDPYERQHEQELQRRKQSKLKEKEQSFTPNSFKPSLFNEAKSVYGLDREIQKPDGKQLLLNILKHQSPWRPANPIKQGSQGLFTPVHPYIENPPTQLKRQREAQQKCKQSFRGMSVSLSKPSPSVGLNKVNMMKYLNKSFSPNK